MENSEQISESLQHINLNALPKPQVEQTEENEPTHQVPESTVSFRRISDKMPIQVKAENGEVVAQISGYGLEVGFNYKFFKTQEDMEIASAAIADLIVKLIMDTTLEAARKANAEKGNG